MRGSEKQITLGELINTLKRKDPETEVTFDFVHFRPTGVHSYRGYYEDLAIGYESGSECKVGTLLAKLIEANGKDFTGYKGGEFMMHRDTVVWVANHNEAGGTAIVDVVDDEWRVILKTAMVD